MDLNVNRVHHVGRGPSKRPVREVDEVENTKEETYPEQEQTEEEPEEKVKKRPDSERLIDWEL